MTCVLVQDPLHPYAVHLMELVFRRYGHRSVCFFTDGASRAQHERAYPTLRTELVEANYHVSLDELPRFAESVRRRHGVVGVLPFNEQTVLASAQLADALGLGWNRLETMLRFRDKYAMKQFLRERHPHMRVNGSRRVEGIEDVLPGGAPRYERYVIKPNDGWGNRDVAVFDAATPRASVEAYLDRVRSSREPPPLVLEEYVGGVEYFVNGQAGARGEPAIVAIFRYGRVDANGRRDIDHETRSVPRADPAFAPLAAYARALVEASGLVRSPFHIEIKLDAQGPCLIEMSARFAGNRNAYACNALHGGRLDVFAAAAHGYVSKDDYGPLGEDWDRYDATAAVYVHGIATRRERVHSLRGVSEVERLPSFAGWVKKPRLGERVVPTVSSLTMPWCVLLMCSAGRGAGAEDADSARVRALMEPAPAAARPVGAAAAIGAAGARAADAVRWRVVRALHSAESTVRAGGPREAVSRAADAVVRRLRRAGLLRRYRADRLPDALSPEHVALANEVLHWAKEYIAAPHPELGRKGPICPFVQKTMQVNRLYVSIHDEIDGAARRDVDDVVLAHADRLKERFPYDAPDGAFTSVVIVFPGIPEERGHVLDDVHDELKTHLMRRDLMAAAFHPRSTKPGQYNPAFRVFRAPFACMVLRHMDVRDILFLGNNRAAFEHYRAVFGPRFAQGQVSNEFGYVDLFNEASRRFPEK
jgi:hypothetical protein